MELRKCDTGPVSIHSRHAEQLQKEYKVDTTRGSTIAQYLDGFLRHTREVEVGERGGGA